MEWSRMSADVRMCQAVMERGGIIPARSSVVLVVNVALPRLWWFKLRFRGEDVLRWDLGAGRKNHSNSGCPKPPFPPRVTSADQEHRYVEGLGLRCAVALSGMSEASHEEAFAAFCRRANVDFGPRYAGLASGEQLRMRGLNQW
jgi:hypothetical protein